MENKTDNIHLQSQIPSIWQFSCTGGPGIDPKVSITALPITEK